MTEVQVLDLSADRMRADVVAVFFFEDDRPLRGPAGLADWRLNGLLTGLLLEGKAAGRPGENILVRSNGKLAAEWVLFAGGGKRQEFAGRTLEILLLHLLETCRLARFSRVSLCFGKPEGVEVKTMEHLANRLLAEMGNDVFECLLSIRDDHIH
jgi:hypothetical protein